MSWTLSLTDVGSEDVRGKAKELFRTNYPDPADGVGREFESAIYCVEESMYDGFTDTPDKGSRFNVQMSGHVSDGDSESFISVIVTLRKPEMMTGNEVKEAQAQEPVAT